MNKFKTNKVADNVSMLVANIKTLYAQQKTYDDLDNYNAVSMGVVPDELVASNDKDKKVAKLTNAFNGDVNIKTASSTTAGDKKAFTITFSGLSREACITLATNDWGSGYSSGLIYIKASKAAITADEVSDTDTGLIGCKGSVTSGSETACPGGSVLPVPMSVVTAALACGCKDGNNCSIQWKYY